MKRDTRLHDLPEPRHRQNALSESEDEEEELVEDGVLTMDSPPLEKAVLQLTKIMDTLAKRKHKGRGIEAIFDNLDGAVDSSASSSSGKSKAAAYKKLKNALQENPILSLPSWEPGLCRPLWAPPASAL